MDLYTRVAAGVMHDNKPLPSLPSPTLTNPDMVLPDDLTLSTLPPSRMRRPPSPGYLRDKTNEVAGSQLTLARDQPGEKRGLMSRKLMLMRSRTASGEGQTMPTSTAPAVVAPSTSSALPSSPILPADTSAKQKERRQSSGGSSMDSDELASMPEFLQKYKIADSTEDEFTDGEIATSLHRLGHAGDEESELDARRKAQEEEEHASALLSQRAEEILANAKKRLNLMEGNLRGARDLVAPLTAANLKRAASLGSSTSSAGYAYGQRRPASRDYNRPAQGQPRYRVLHSQASSPTIGRDYQGHLRGYSETELPERPQTALARMGNLVKPGRIPVIPSDPNWGGGLRASRSFDSIGINASPSAGARERQYQSKDSPDSKLESLPEDNDDDQQYPDAADGNLRVGLGVFRSGSSSAASEDLRDQMSSLKGKISTLKERAREDSLRRQSMNNLRNPSPLNNATHNAPELWYAGSTSGSNVVPPLDANVDLAYSSGSSPITPQLPQPSWIDHQRSGSRNAFAEQAARRERQASGSSSSASNPTYAEHRGQTQPPQHQQPHKRTASGKAIVAPAKKRFSHHRYTHSRDVPGSFDSYDSESSDGGADYDEDVYDPNMFSPPDTGEPSTPDYDYEVSDLSHDDEEVRSVYEDAELEQMPLAHEDREDAFDYEHFFLHSAMGSYNSGRHTPDSESDGSSVSSAGTARAPQIYAHEEFDDGDDVRDDAPSTPPHLREIERRLGNNHRSMSRDSVSSFATFATATEGRNTPGLEFDRNMEWPAPPAAETSRPSTAVRQLRPPPSKLLTETDDGSDRADSGVGGLAHGVERSTGDAAVGKASSASAAGSPVSPTTTATATTTHDPTAVAVNALLDPSGKPLGLKDNAVLFGLIESLRKVCVGLQEEDESQYESRVLRRRLDEARRVLDGLAAVDAQ